MQFWLVALRSRGRVFQSSIKNPLTPKTAPIDELNHLVLERVKSVILSLSEGNWLAASQGLLEIFYL